MDSSRPLDGPKRPTASSHLGPPKRQSGTGTAGERMEPELDDAYLQCPICFAWFPVFGDVGWFRHLRAEHPDSTLARQVDEWMATPPPTAEPS
jgi:hypothetical protein